MQGMVVIILTVTLGSGSLWATGGVFDVYQQTFGDAKWHKTLHARLDACSGTLTESSGRINNLGNMIANWVSTGNLNTKCNLTDHLTAPYVEATGNSGIWPHGPGFVAAADYGIPSRATLLAAQAAAGTKQIVLAPGIWTIDQNTTITSPLKVMPGAVLTRSGGNHLYINGAFECGVYRVFNDNSVTHDWVIFGRGAVKEIVPHYWKDPANGDWSNAFHAAFNSTVSENSSSKLVSVFVPPGHYTCNLQINHSYITLKGAGRGITNFSSYDTTKPVWTVGDGTNETRYCLFSDFSIGYEGAPVTASDAILLNGAYECKFNNFMIWGISGNGIHLHPTGTQSNYFNYFDNFEIDWVVGACVKSESGGSPVVFGNNACYFSNGVIHGYNTVGKSYVLWANDKTYWTNVYCQASNQCGLFFSGNGSGVYGSQFVVESNDGVSAVTVEFDKDLTGKNTYSITTRLDGNCDISGYIKFHDGTTKDITLINWLTWGHLLYNPTIQGNLFFYDYTRQTNNQQFTNTGKAYIGNNGGNLTFSSSNEFRFSNDISIKKTAPVLKLNDLSTDVTIANSSGNVYINPAAGKSIKISGLQVYANNAAALAGGLTAGMLYRTGGDPDFVCVVH